MNEETNVKELAKETAESESTVLEKDRPPDG